MSQLQQNQFTKIIHIQNLPNQWTLWFSYSCDQQNGINYGNNLMEIQKVKSWNQFALLWKWVSKTQNFFINPQNGSFNKFKFGLQQRKIDSINFFKDDIQPQWQYGDNPKYGYYNFGIDRTSQKTNQIFESSVYLGVGQSQQWAKDIFGIRIIDLSAKPTHPSRARIQIWVKYRHDNSKQSLDRLLNFQDKIRKYYKQTINQQISQIKFFNISNTSGEQLKTPKKQNKKNQGYNKNNKKGNQYKY